MSYALSSPHVETGTAKMRSYSGDYMELGQAGEKVVVDFLTQQPGVERVEDLRELKHWQQKSVDFRCWMTDGSCRLVEAKSDTYLGNTGNLLFEILRIYHTSEPDISCVVGWSVHTDAHYIVYYGPSCNLLVVCRARELKRAFQKYTANAREDTRVKWIPTDRIKSTLIVLLPEQYWTAVAQCYKIVENGGPTEFQKL